MNSFLLGLGVAVILLLAGALAAPFFIDWSTHRGLVENQLERLTGAEVAIEGPLDVTLLPMPRVSAEDVVIGSNAEDGVTVEQIELTVALTPLLKGDIDVQFVRLVGPVVTLRRGAGGRLTGPGGFNLPDGADRIALADIDVSGGRIRVETDTGDAAAPAVLDIGPVNLSATARALAGPYRAEGTARFRDEPVRFRFVTGTVGEAGGMRLRLSVEPANRPLAIDLDGRLGDGAGPVYQGDLSVERYAMADSATDPLEAWRLSGTLTADAEILRLDGAEIELGPEERRAAMTGSAELSLGDAPAFSASVEADRMDLDRLLALPVGGAGGFAEAAAAIAETFSGTLGDVALPGDIRLAIGSLVAAGSVIEEVRGALAIDGGALVVERLTARLPGGADFRFAGAVADVEAAGTAATAVSGDASVAAAQGRVFLRWLLGDLAGPLDWLSGSGDLSATVTYGAGRLDLDDAEIVFAETEARGRLAYDWPDADAPARLTLVLDASRFPFEGLQSLSRLALARDDAASATALDLDVAIDTVTGRDVDIEGLRLLGRAADGAMTLDRLEVADLAGIALTGAGEARDVPSTPTGAFRLTARADDLADLTDLLPRLGLADLADGLAERAGALSPVRVDLSLDLGDGAVAARATGRAGAADVALTLRRDTQGLALRRAADLGRVIDGAGVDLALSSTQADDLLAIIGLDLTGDLSPADVRMTLEPLDRAGDDPAAPTHDLTVDIAAFGGTVDGTGRLALGNGIAMDGASIDGLDLAVDLPDLWRLAPLAGVVAPDGARPAGFDGRIAARRADDGLEIALRRATLAGQAIEGTLLRDGLTERLSGALRVETLDLDLLSETAAGLRVALPLRGAPWAADVLSWRLPDGLDARLDLVTDRVRGGGLTVDNAAMVLTSGDGRLSVADLEGRLFGGLVSADIDLARAGDSVRGALRFALEGADLGEIAWRRDGRAVVTGDLAATGEITALGRSLSAMVGALEGSGRVEITDGALRGVSAVAFDEIVAWSDALGRAAQDVDPLRVETVFADYLDRGSLDFGAIDASFTIAGGVARAPSILFRDAALDVRASARVELLDRWVASQWGLRSPEGGDGTGPVREAGFIFEGPLAGPTRLLDVAPLVSYLEIRAFEREVERFEQLDLEAELGPPPPDIDEAVDGDIDDGSATDGAATDAVANDDAVAEDTGPGDAIIRPAAAGTVIIDEPAETVEPVAVPAPQPVPEPVAAPAPASVPTPAPSVPAAPQPTPEPTTPERAAPAPVVVPLAPPVTVGPAPGGAPIDLAPPAAPQVIRVPQPATTQPVVPRPVAPQPQARQPAPEPERTPIPRRPSFLEPGYDAR